MSALYVLLDVDPSIVRPGWIALFVTLFVGVALALLFFSMRRQVRKISPELPYAHPAESDGAEPSAAQHQAPDITGSTN